MHEMMPKMMKETMPEMMAKNSTMKEMMPKCMADMMPHCVETFVPLIEPEEKAELTSRLKAAMDNVGIEYQKN